MDFSATLTTSWTLLKRRPPTILRLSTRLSGSRAAPAVLCALLAHLLPLRFAHALVYRFLRRRFPMTLSRGIDWSATAARGRGDLWLRRCFLPQGTLGVHLIEQVGGTVSNLTHRFAERFAVEPALGFGLDRANQKPELLRKRDDPVFNVVARRLR